MIELIKNKIQTIHLTSTEKRYLLFTLFAYIFYSVYHIFHYPVYIDEASTYLDYASKNISSIASNYEEPNNHVFFSIIAHIFQFIPIDHLISLRIPNLIIGVFTTTFLYLFIRSFYGHKGTVLPHLFFTFSYFFTYYSVFARGYMIIILMALICFYCVLQLSKDFNKNYILIYLICSIIGLYTIPIFLYVSSTLVLFQFILFKKETSKLLLLLKYHIIIGIVTFLLYLPIIYFNGLDSIINNQWTKKLPLNQVIDCFKDRSVLGLFDKLIGINSFYLIVLFLITLLFIYLKKATFNEKRIIQFIFISFLLPFVFILVQRVIPGTRTWCYLLIPLTLGVTLIYSKIIELFKLKTILSYTAGVIIIFLFSVIFHKSHPHAAKEKDFTITQLSEQLQKRKYSSIYSEFGPKTFEEVNIRFNYARIDKKLNFYNRSSNLKKLDLTKIDCFIVHSDSKLIQEKELKNNELVFEEDGVFVYGR